MMVQTLRSTIKACFQNINGLDLNVHKTRHLSLENIYVNLFDPDKKNGY